MDLVHEALRLAETARGRVSFAVLSKIHDSAGVYARALMKDVADGKCTEEQALDKLRAALAIDDEAPWYRRRTKVTPQRWMSIHRPRARWSS
jgi:hypothetical protein